ALICRTGGKPALGTLASSLAEKPPATAFAIGIRRFAMLIMRFTVLMVLFVLVVNIYFHRPGLEALMFALAPPVGLTPERVPKRRMSGKGARENLLRLSGQYQGADGAEQPLDAETRHAFEATLAALG